MSEFRRDPIIGRWVIISTNRGRRPSEFSREVREMVAKSCPFCPGHEDMTPPSIIAYDHLPKENNSGSWSLRVVPNKFPALAVEGSLDRMGQGMYDKMSGVGAHEVIIESPDHTKEFHELTDKQAQDIIWAYRDRIIDLKNDLRLQYILILKNRGAAAGATLAHPHSQLIATPIVPKRVREEIQGSLSYFNYKERCIYCDIIREELAAEARIVAENEYFFAFCPFASRFPFEVCVIPKEHNSRFEDIHHAAVLALTSLMKDVLGKINRVLDNPPYNYVIHNAPLRDPSLPHYHWHIEIMPKLIQVAGFEWGTGFYINPTPPEEAAKFLRESE